MCAKGDDPLTTAQYDKAIRLSTGNTNGAEALTGEYYITFAGQRSSALSADATSFTNTSCAAAFEAMENIDSARCFLMDYDPTTLAGEYIIALQFAFYGQNNLHNWDNDPDLSLFTCDMSDVAASITGTPTCAITADVDLSVRRYMSVSSPCFVPYSLCFVQANFTGVSDPTTGASDYYIWISDDTSVPNQFQFSVGNFTSNQTYIDQDLMPQNLTDYHVIVQFASTVGHTAGARWKVAATTDGVTLMEAPRQKEHESCGGRGTCDETTGICTCTTDTEFVLVLWLWLATSPHIWLVR